MSLPDNVKVAIAGVFVVATAIMGAIIAGPSASYDLAGPVTISSRMITLFLSQVPGAGSVLVVTGEYALKPYRHLCTFQSTKHDGLLFSQIKN